MVQVPLLQQLKSTVQRLFKRESARDKFDWLLDAAILVEAPTLTHIPPANNALSHEVGAGRRPDFWIKSCGQKVPVTTVRVEKTPGPVSLPVSAIVYADGAYVFKLEEGYLRRQMVTLEPVGPIDENVLVSGIAVGDSILCPVPSYVADGMPVFELGN